MVLVITALGIILKLESAHIDKLNTEVGELNTSLSSCQRINEENTKEFNKLVAAKAIADAVATEADKNIKAISSQLTRKILEISNAKDNGPIPGVLQRTLDELRSRTKAGHQDREGSPVHTS
jgi:hypothetical protein